MAQRRDNFQPEKHIRSLDEWVLKSAGKDTTVDQLYEDIRATCRSRVLVAEDKSKKSKKQESDSIGNVAASIVFSIDARLKTKNFPDDFVNNLKLDLPFVFDRGSLREITIAPLLDRYEIEVATNGGLCVYSGAHPRPVAEAIVRAILLGRSTFSVSTDRKVMDEALNRFLEWMSEAEAQIQKAIRDSAFGTGYEDALRKEIYVRLGIHPLTGVKMLPAQISL